MDIKGAAIAITYALEMVRIDYVIAGRYAVELICAHRDDGPKYDSSETTLTVLVDRDPEFVAYTLVESGQHFAMTSSLGLVFDPDVGYVSAPPIYIQILQSNEKPLYLPWVFWAPKLNVAINSVICVPVMHPKVYAIATARLWNFSKEQSMARMYLADLVCLLQWLAEKRIELDLDGYGGPQKHVLYMTFSAMFSLHDEYRGLLQAVLEPNDFMKVRDEAF